MEVDNTGESAIIAEERMIDEGQTITFWGEAQITDPARSFVQQGANRVLQTSLAIGHLNDRQRTAIGSPISLLNVVQQIARSIRADGKASQRPDMRE